MVTESIQWIRGMQEPVHRMRAVQSLKFSLRRALKNFFCFKRFKKPVLCCRISRSPAPKKRWLNWTSWTSVWIESRIDEIISQNSEFRGPNNQTKSTGRGECVRMAGQWPLERLDQRDPLVVRETLANRLLRVCARSASILAVHAVGTLAGSVPGDAGRAEWPSWIARAAVQRARRCALITGQRRRTSRWEENARILSSLHILFTFL